MSESNILIQVEQHVTELFAKRSACENIYHNLSHTTEVVDVAEKIAVEENLSNEDIEILLISAWFHDTGYFHCYRGHEDQSAEYARDFLIRISFPEEKINKILDCIKATKIPHNPLNKLEQIICDADLQHLGMTDIEERGEVLRKELEIKGIKKINSIEWLKSSIDFLLKHKFFTDYAIRMYGEQKRRNLTFLQKKLAALE